MKTTQTANSAAGVTDENLCSFKETGAEKMCSTEQSVTCGDSRIAVKG